jgi:tRNA A37 threonylcarbamoyladenosine synthetase subunit TsaC/SUA5/YrdC
MGERFSLVDDNTDRDELIERAVAALRDGQLIIAPLEHAYVFVGDAFNHGAVKKIHRLRQDPRGVAAQVIVGDIKTVKGITREFGSAISALCEKFWPGLFTVNIGPAQGLVWDLGDERTLEEISVRVPAADFIRDVAQQPLQVDLPQENRSSFPVLIAIMQRYLMRANSLKAQRRP